MADFLRKKVVHKSYIFVLKSILCKWRISAKHGVLFTERRCIIHLSHKLHRSPQVLMKLVVSTAASQQVLGSPSQLTGAFLCSDLLQACCSPVVYPAAFLKSAVFESIFPVTLSPLTLFITTGY